MSDTPPSSRFAVFDNDENQFVEQIFRDVESATAKAREWAAGGQRHASFSVYELHGMFNHVDSDVK